MSAKGDAIKAAVYSAVSEDWETAPGWEVEVAAPVNRHMLAPRDARAILEVAGQLADHGLPAALIVARLNELHPHWRGLDPQVGEQLAAACRAKGLPFHDWRHEHGEVTVWLDEHGSSITAPLTHIFDMIAAIDVVRAD